MKAAIGVALFILAFFFCACGVMAMMSGRHTEEDMIKMAAYSGGLFMCLIGALVVAIGIGVMI